MRLLGLSPLALGSIVGILLLLTHAYQNWEEWFADNTLPLDEAGNPEMTAKNLRQLSYNKDGEKQYLLEAETMIQFGVTDENQMVQPKVLFFHNQAPSWQTQAAKAVSTQQGSELLLTGNVLIRQQGVEPPATLETATLTLYPDRYFATTKDKVIIRQSGVYIEATGMEADLNRNKLILQKNVTSIYEPEKYDPEKS